MKIARGSASVTGSLTVVTGLTNVVACGASMADDAILTAAFASATPGDQAGTPAAGSIIVKVWKPTGTGDATPIASAVAKTVTWWAIGS